MIRLLALAALLLASCPGAEPTPDDLRARCEYIGQIVTEGKIGIVCTIDDVEASK